MNQLTTEVKTHVLITYSKSTYFLTKNQEAKLKYIGLNDTIEIDGNKIKGANIAEIIKIEEYYKQHPQKREEHTNYTFEEFKSYQTTKIEPVTKEKRIRALRSMIKGFKEYFSNKEIPKHSQAILSRMEKSLQETIDGVKDYYDSPLKDNFLNV